MSDEADGLHSGASSPVQCHWKLKAKERNAHKGAQKAKSARPAGFSRMLGNLVLLACYMLISVTNA